MDDTLEPTKARTVIFVHIPKTAGTTFNSILSYQYGYRYTISVHLEKVSEGYRSIGQEMSGSQRGRVRLVRGHIPFGWHGLFDQPVTYITFLRDPIKRVISLYRYAKYGTQGPWCDLAASCKNLEEFITSSVTTMVDNGQVRQLIDHSVGYGCCTAEMLEEAKRNLEERFSVVGLTERFDESLVVVKRVLGWKKPLFYLPAKVAAKRHPSEEVSDRVVGLIREHNDLDMQLYEYASMRFEKLVDKHKISLEKEVRKLRRINRLCGYTLPIPLKVFRSIKRNLSLGGSSLGS